MQLKITRSHGESYAQIVQSYRDPVTGRPKQKHMCSLGRVDKLDPKNVDSLIDGLLRVTDRPELKTMSAAVTAEGTEFETALSVGDVWAVMGIWKQLRLAATLSRHCGSQRQEIDVEKLVRVMVVNRLCAPRSKLGILEWLETAYLPGVDRSAIQHQHLLRAMDALLAGKDALQQELAQTLLPLFDQEMQVVFYDVTAIPTSGQTKLDGDLRQYGKSKRFNGVERQYAIGVVQTADGFPIAHDVFEGNVNEKQTLVEAVRDVTRRYDIKRVVIIADRGMVSEMNLEALPDLSTEDCKVDLILGVPINRYSTMAAAVGETIDEARREGRKLGREVVKEAVFNERRVVIAFNPKIERTMKEQRARRFVEAERLGRSLLDRLEGESSRGRQLTDLGAYHRLRDFVRKYNLAAFYKVDLKEGLVTWHTDVDVLKQRLRNDGILLLVTTCDDLSATDVLRRYRELADIENGFRVLKSELDIAPSFHRKPERIRSHALICFLALVIHRTMRYRLRKAQVEHSVRRALSLLGQIQVHRARLNTGTELSGVGRVSPEQLQLFEALDVDKPTSTKVLNAV